MVSAEFLGLSTTAVQILNALDDGVTVFDREATLVWANARACEIFGMPRDDIVGLNISEIATLPTVKAFQTNDFGGNSSTTNDTRCRYRGLTGYMEPGYVEFVNGTRMLYVCRIIKDALGNLQYAVYTQHDTTALDEAKRRIVELEKLANMYRDQLEVLHPAEWVHNIVCASDELKQVLSRASKIARLGSTVLVTGETGVGKNLLAKYIHLESSRASGPFIQVNCACLPESLVEAELFGYVEGSFTGANRKGHRGLIQLADSGTLFLDEITEMPMSMQAKLLSVIEEKTFRKIGAERWTKVDVRIIAASNKDRSELSSGRVLRPDLYYRLSMSCVHVPPLRERKNDIPALVAHVIEEFNEINGTNLSLHAALVEMIAEMPLRGNAREIRNLIWQIAVEYSPDSDPLKRIVIPPQAAHSLQAYNSNIECTTASPPIHNLNRDINKEAADFAELATRYDGDVYKLAQVLDVHRTTVIRKLKRYGIPYARRRQSVEAYVSPQ